MRLQRPRQPVRRRRDAADRAEIHDGLQTGLAPQDFTMRTIADRLATVGDLWAPLRAGPPADLRTALQYSGAPDR